MQTQNVNTLESLPPVTAMSLTDRIIAAYRKTVTYSLAFLVGDELKRAKDNLFFSYRPGAGVSGVNSPIAVERMFKRITVPSTNIQFAPLPSYPKTNAEGHKVYCFQLPPPYKGKTNYGDLDDILAMHDLDRVGFGLEYDPEDDEMIIRIQAPEIKEVPCNYVTVILSADETEFIAWFCGKPKKLWDASSIRLLLRADGTLDLGALEVRIDTNYTHISEETRRQNRQWKPKFINHNYTPKIKQVETPVNPPINPVAQALTAVATT